MSDEEEGKVLLDNWVWTNKYRKNDLRKSLVNAKTCGLMFEKRILI